MADSDDSRTLPSITRGKANDGVSRARCELFTRKNLMSSAKKLLQTRMAALREQQQICEPGSTPAAELWRKWLHLHQRRLQMTRRQQDLEGRVLAEAGSFPVVTISVPGWEKPANVNTVAEIELLKPHLASAQVVAARSELRRLRRLWKKADSKLGYSAALASERELSERESMLAREMALADPLELIEIIAKLHCVMAMEDPGLRHEAPWPQLRIILGDLVRMEQGSTADSRAPPATSKPSDA